MTARRARPTPTRGTFTDVTLTATDLGSGVGSTHYTTDGSDPTLSSPTYTGPFCSPSRARCGSGPGTSPATPSAIGFAGPHDRSPAPDTDAPVSTITCNGAPCTAAAYTGAVIGGADRRRTARARAWQRSSTRPTAPRPTSTSPAYTAPFDVQQNDHRQVLRHRRRGQRRGAADAARADHRRAGPGLVRLGRRQVRLYNLAWQRALQPHDVRSTFYINSGDVGTGESGAGRPAS